MTLFRSPSSHIALALAMMLSPSVRPLVGVRIVSSLSANFLSSRFTDFRKASIRCHHVDETETTTFKPERTNEAYALARRVFSNYKSRSWKRLSLLVDLAFQDQATTSLPVNRRRLTAVDIGTDHGLLAAGLAASGKFESVIGVDVSETALDNGGRKLEKELRQNFSETLLPGWELPVSFRCGSGLSVLEKGEADITCIAGMGSRTMVEILSARNTTTGDFVWDDLGCQSLVLQPTNSRPRNLSQLYQALFEMGWVPVDERIVYVPTRWYLTTMFHRNADESGSMPSEVPVLPGSIILNQGNTSDDSEQFETIKDYCNYHKHWLQSLLELGKSKLHPLEYRWLASVESFTDQN